jgi:CheY-like chemotaxis protein
MKTLLIVEDSHEFRRMLRSMLRGYYDEIYECTDGKDVPSAYERYKPDCVLMDIHMKEVDGLTATKRLKQQHANARVVIMTQSSEPDLYELAISNGAEKLIMKENLYDLKKAGV